MNSNETSQELLKLDNQLCFPLYAASRMVTKAYQPLLKELDLTYPQYLIFLVLWEEGSCTVSRIGQRLLLESSTLTPLLKRLETKGFVVRQRSVHDERKVEIRLTEKGKDLKIKACPVPRKLGAQLAEIMPLERILRLKEDLHLLLDSLQKE